MLICSSFVLSARNIVSVLYLLFRLANYKEPCKLYRALPLGGNERSHICTISALFLRKSRNVWQNRKENCSFELQINTVNRLICREHVHKPANNSYLPRPCPGGKHQSSFVPGWSLVLLEDLFLKMNFKIRLVRGARPT